MAVTKVLTRNQISQVPSPLANGPSARSLALLSGAYPSRFGKPSSALDNDSNGPQKIVTVVRDAIRRSMIDQLDLPSYRPLRLPKTAGLSLFTLDHSVPRSLCPMRDPDIDRASRTQSKLVFTVTTLAEGSICMHHSTRSASATSCPPGCGIGSWMVDSCRWSPATRSSSLWTLRP
jgi:hypothetical protein